VFDLPRVHVDEFVRYRDFLRSGKSAAAEYDINDDVVTGLDRCCPLVLHGLPGAVVEPGVLREHVDDPLILHEAVADDVTADVSHLSLRG